MYNKKVTIVFKCGIERTVNMNYFENVIMKTKALKDNIRYYSY